MTIQEIYAAVLQVTPHEAMRAVQKAETDEERGFYAYVADMALQRAQKAVIEANLF